jgi:hypothetical protein
MVSAIMSIHEIIFGQSASTIASVSLALNNPLLLQFAFFRDILRLERYSMPPPSISFAYRPEPSLTTGVVYLLA